MQTWRHRIWQAVSTLAACFLAAGAYLLAIALAGRTEIEPLVARLAQVLPRGVIVGSVQYGAIILPDSLSTGLALLAVLSLANLLLFSLAYAATVAAYGRWGWPPYMAELRGEASPPGLLARVWTHGIWLTAPCLPLSGLVWMGWWRVQHAGLAHGVAILVDLAIVSLVAIWLLVVLGQGILVAGVLRRQVVQAIACGARRCDSCGYPLRGLPAETACPECGSAPSHGPVTFRLGRAHRSVWWSRSAQVGAALALVMTPVLYPWIAQVLPRGLRPMIGAPLVTPELTPNPNTFALPVDKVASIRRGPRLALLRLLADGGQGWSYQAWYWEDASIADRSPPTSVHQGTLPAPAWSAITIGPWTLHVSEGDSQFAWLYRPDGSWDIRIVDLATLRDFGLKSAPGPD